MGNVRRVLSVTRKRPPTSEDWNDTSLASGVDRRGTVLGATQKPLESGSASSLTMPRRSVSASAELFRRKQSSAREWSAGNRSSREMTFQPPIRDDFALDGLLDNMIGVDDINDDDDEDWDVEGAIEGRRVQMTYTVPKERLRVVNATARDMDNFSEKSISRSNSEA